MMTTMITMITMITMMLIQWHPDKRLSSDTGQDPMLHREKFLEIQMAWETLSSVEQRRTYDQRRKGTSWAYGSMIVRHRSLAPSITHIATQERAEKVVFFAEVTLDDMIFHEEDGLEGILGVSRWLSFYRGTDAFTMECRCGGEYRIHMDVIQLEQSYQLACTQCSLRLMVHAR